MATSYQPRGGTRTQLRLTHKLLPKAFIRTFDTEADARAFGDQLKAILAVGAVPQDLLEPAADGPGGRRLVRGIIEDYLHTQPVAKSDRYLLEVLAVEVAGLRTNELSYGWAEAWVRSLKVEKNLAPGTVRKRVGSLARVLDWHFKKVPGSNPLRLLPRGYSAYAREEEQAVAARGGEAKGDVSRDRRLAPEEEERVRWALAGGKREDRERPWPVDEELSMLFDLIVDTGMRLREGYRLRLDQVDLTRGIVNVEGTNKRGGGYKPRVVPLKPALRARLKDYLKGRVGRLFPSLWDGTEEDLRGATNRLSTRFKALFDYAGVEGMAEHDLRHEATCRWFELKKPNGAWVFSDLEICKIMGWTDTKMALRYLSLRGEDLAARLL